MDRVKNMYSWYMRGEDDVAPASLISPKRSSYSPILETIIEEVTDKIDVRKRVWVILPICLSVATLYFWHNNVQ